MSCDKCGGKTVWKKMGRLKMGDGRVVIKECVGCGYITQKKIVSAGRKS